MILRVKKIEPFLHLKTLTNFVNVFRCKKKFKKKNGEFFVPFRENCLNRKKRVFWLKTRKFFRFAENNGDYI